MEPLQTYMLKSRSKKWPGLYSVVIFVHKTGNQDLKIHTAPNQLHLIQKDRCIFLFANITLMTWKFSNNSEVYRGAAQYKLNCGFWRF